MATLVALARSPDVRDLGSRPDPRGVLERALADTPDWDSLEIRQADGTFVLGVGSVQGTSNLVDQPEVRQALAAGRPAIGPAVAGPQTLAPSVPLIAPIPFVTGADGAMIARLSLSRLVQAIAGGEPGGGVHVQLVDPDGSVIARSDSGEAAPAAPAGGEGRSWPAVAGEAGVSSIVLDGGAEMLVARAPVPDAPWAVLVVQPRGDAFGPIRRQLLEELGLLAVTALVIASLTLHLGSRLTRAYARQIDEASQVDQFVAAASHDLKTPLTAVKTRAQLLKRRLARADPPDGRWLEEGLGEIDAVATKMARQINALLDATRVRRGSVLELQPRPVDLVALTRRVAAEHQETTEHHTLLVDSTVESLTGSWDGERLERVVANLLGNAIKYSPAGGEICVRIRLEPARAHRTDVNGATSGDAWVTLTVQDQGLGIPARDLPHIFERYRRGGNVAGTISGSGIGLAGARQIVEQHGGEITAASDGAGSTFTVRLPLAPEA
jgi:signal transduction histidine kinase